MHSVTPVNTFTTPVIMFDDGDPVSNASSAVLAQSLTDRTQYLRRLFIDETITVSAGGTTTMSAASSGTQILTGSANQSYKLPDETTIVVGESYQFLNLSTGTMTVKDSAGTTLFTVPPHAITNKAQYAVARSTSAGAATGNWYFSCEANEIVSITPTAQSLTSGSNVNISSIALTPGTWRISGGVRFVLLGPTNVAILEVGVSTTSAGYSTFSQGPSGVGTFYSSADFAPVNMSAGGAFAVSIVVPSYLFSITANTTYYLVCDANWTASTGSATGWLQAERVR